ncbi:MAG: hypothetical protein Q8865_08700 [Bacillota bacterium]|nr:hypothetical protein [Bacillota bacterium]
MNSELICNFDSIDSAENCAESIRNIFGRRLNISILPRGKQPDFNIKEIVNVVPPVTYVNNGISTQEENYGFPLIPYFDSRAYNPDIVAEKAHGAKLRITGGIDDVNGAHSIIINRGGSGISINV